MSQISSFRQIIDLWPTRSALAREIGTTVEATFKWRRRNSIPSEWWSPLLELDRAREAGVTADLLTELAAKREIHNTSPITQLRTV